MEKVVVRISNVNPVLLLYRNHPIYLLHKSVEWFLYNDNIGLNGKMDSSLR